jgi:hypothetical protein
MCFASRYRRLVLCLAAIMAVANGCARAGGSDPLRKAYAFLDSRMDRRAQGATLRLIQSYVPTTTFSNGDTSYTYDDAVAIIAFLARGRSDDVARARVLADSLVYVQRHDPAADGRLRDAYHAEQFVRANGTPNIANAASHTGNLAWAGMALAQLYRATKQQPYLDAALALANFIQTNTFDIRGGNGGYTGGFDAGGQKVQYKSSEHNIDVYAFFTMLNALSGDTSWQARASHALKLVAATWDAPRGFFWIGTGLDGKTINKSDPVPEDVQTWSFLATHRTKFRGSIDWALTNLTATRGGFDGLSFSLDDRSGVWFEGTAHAAAALRARALGKDAEMAATLISDIETGQTSAPNADGHGIDAASKDGLRTGDGAGDAYYAALHIGATAWYCLAKQGKNPFQLLR